ncbi:MAG: cysteine-rich CWC family protein [Acidovorax sp.]
MTADTTLCPLCGQPNQCAVAAGLPAEQCWCMSAPISREVLRDALARLPEDQRGQACLCPACGRDMPPETPPI